VSAEAVEKEASAPVVGRTAWRGQVAESEPVGDVGVVEVANGEVPAEDSGVVAPLNQVTGGVSGCLGEGSELPGLRVGHEQGVSERRFPELQVAPVGDVSGDALPRVLHAPGPAHDRVHLRSHKLADDGIDQDLAPAGPIVDGGFADPGGRRDFL
jgi:hypothetical protein